METSITLKQLSHLSGFSVSTVSKALNNKFDISLKTRQLIKSIANENNYIPNNHAVALRKKKTNTVAVILPQINDEFYSCFLHNIEKVAFSFGYRIILFQSFEDHEKLEECILKINDGTVDGIILLTESKTNHTYNYSKTSNLPLEHILVSKNKTQKQLKLECINNFTKLIESIL
ncbi:LacI family DNA-binding transcriptional regulator [Lacinutrix iliipiscaria]|uniref:LacI family DNA-binding transcriptional regulator n=1 Tax=Lacinutrix iliipiscaria TaxID=1230532 RepID=A0ABW5WJV5_9FLAO